MLRVKEGVIFKSFPDSILTLLESLHSSSEELGKDIYITSANDGKHMPNSLHYKDLALDIRIRNLDEGQVNYLLNDLDILNGYDVVQEKDHIHVEYDPK